MNVNTYYFQKTVNLPSLYHYLFMLLFSGFTKRLDTARASCSRQTFHGSL